MDFGDLIFLLIVGFGLLTQLVGGKKKRPPVQRPRPVPRPQPPTRTQTAMPSQHPSTAQLSTVPGRVAPPAPDAKPSDARSYMERLLRELDLDEFIEKRQEAEQPPPTPVESPPPAAERERRPDVTRLRDVPPPPPVPVDRPLPSPEGRSIETLEPAGGASHVRFHEKYLSGKPSPARVRMDRARVTKLLNPQSLRQAILLKEILGPPKSL